MKTMVAVIIAITILGFIIFSIIREHKIMSKAKETGCVIKATLAGSRVYNNRSYKGSNERNGSRYKNTKEKYKTELVGIYEYIVDGITYEKRVTIDSSSKSGYVSMPREVTIYYDKDNPKRSVYKI